MSITVSDPVDVGAESQSAATANRQMDAAFAPSRLREWSRPIALRVRMLVMSAAVWMLYVPHFTVLWLLGPRYGMAWVRLSARVHWLLTFVGAQRGMRQRLEDLSPFLLCPESVSEILYKHLLLKHECFARVRVYNLHGKKTSRYDVQFKLDPRCVDTLPQAEGRERGLVVVGFHFGSFQLSATALSQGLPGVDPVQVRFRDAQCVEHTASPIARMAIRKIMEADQRSGAKIFYVDANTNVMPILRMLRGGGCVCVAADGMLAEEFLDVPFLDGKLRMPSGWARLVALTHSEIAIVTDRGDDGARRLLSIDTSVQCADKSHEAMHAAVAGVARILERLICEEPWGWHPWQRLRCERDANGVPHYHLQQFSAGPAAKAPRRIEEVDDVQVATLRNSVTPASLGRARPRVAILTNSLTPYRNHLHERIVDEVPEVELWSLSTHGNAYNRWSGVEGPPAIRPVNFGRGEPTNEQTMFRYSLREWRKGGRVIHWLKSHKISAVFCQGCGDVGRLRILRWCQKNGIPCFLTGDFNVRSDRYTGLRRRIKQLVYQRAVGWSSGLMPCGSLGKALFDRYGGTTKQSIDFPFIPDTHLFRCPPAASVAEVRQRFDWNPERRRILFSARMMPVKRPDLALAAFQAIADERPNWDLVMLGEGPLRASLEASVPEHLRHRITWTGFLNTPREIAGLYASCDVLLLPSDHEPWGVVVVEAAAAGLAIVATDVVGAAPELIHPGRNGQLFPPGDLPRMIAALRATTLANVVDSAKQQSQHVLDEWLTVSDPVAGFRTAIDSTSVLKNQQVAAGFTASRLRRIGQNTLVAGSELGAAISIIN